MTSETRPAYAGTRPPKLADHSPGFLAGIGVRLEDDLLVTATGHEVLSGALPIDAAGVELWAREQAR